MPRTARKKADSGVYFVRIRAGEDKLVRDEYDCRLLTQTLDRAVKRDGCTLYAYAVDSASLDIVLMQGAAEVGSTLKDAIAGYVGLYNMRYCRKGRLTRDRFYSLPLESDDEIAEAVIYVHARSGYTGNDEYLGAERLLDTSRVLSAIGREGYERRLHEPQGELAKVIDKSCRN